MALVVEDGTGLATSNSYDDAASIRAYADARGVALPALDADLEPLVLRAMDYLERYRAQYRGAKASAEQALQWPRLGAVVDGFGIGATTVPAELKNALAALVIEAHAGEDLMPNECGRTVKRQKVDVIETEYLGGAARPRFPKVDALLAPLLRRGAFGVTVVRA